MIKISVFAELNEKKISEVLLKKKKQKKKNENQQTKIFFHIFRTDDLYESNIMEKASQSIFVPLLYLSKLRYINEEI